MILRVRHIREARLCLNGARKWFRARGWSWSDFVTNGRPVADFKETRCPLADRAVAVAEREAGLGD